MVDLYGNMSDQVRSVGLFHTAPYQWRCLEKYVCFEGAELSRYLQWLTRAKLGLCLPGLGMEGGVVGGGYS